MDEVINFILLFLAQFAGGPGPTENNLVRFGLPAILWGILLYIAWTRQRTGDHPREKLLVWGFALAFIRETYMLGQMAYRILDQRAEATCGVIQPMEHGLSMIAMILVSGAFIYALSDKALAKCYLQIGIGVTILVTIFTSWMWPQHLARDPGIKFHQSYEAWFFHLPLALFMGVALFLIWRKPGWLRNVVGSAFACYLISELLLLINYATDQVYNAKICPVGNSLHILAAPLLGYVYLKEQAMEKKRAEEALIKYQDHLKELVEERTVELTRLNTKLVQEVMDRSSAEKALERITNRYELILESAGEGICELDHQGRFVYATPAAAKMLGYQPGELINRSCSSIWHQRIETGQPHSLEDCPIYQGYHLGLQRSGEDEYFCHRDGRVFPVHYFSNPVRENGSVTGTLLVFRDITLRKRSENEIAQHNKSLSTQNAVAVTLSQSLHIETNLRKVLEIVRTAVEMEVGWIFLADADHQNLNVYVSSEVVSADESACQRVSQQAYLGKQVVSACLADSREGAIDPCSGQVSIKRLISVPLISKGMAVGAITLGSSSEADLQRYQFELLTSISLQIGMAVENARLYQESETRAEDITRLHEVSSHLSLSIEISSVTDEIARQSAWLLHCSKSCVVNVDHGSDRLTVQGSFGLDPEELLCIQHQLPCWTFLKSLLERPETVAISDTAGDGMLPARLREVINIRSFIILPIWTTEKPCDFIIILDEQATRRWQTREIELIERLANRAAVALMNANLHQQRELAAALEERHRIAANMHDGLAQTLSLLRMKVDRLQDVVEPASGEITAAMDEVHGVVAEALVEVRRSIASLQKTHASPASLQKLIQNLVDSIEDQEGSELHTELKITEPVYLVEGETAQVIPLVQEAILNAIHHANPRTVRVRLERVEMKLQISIEDDGCGFEPNRLDPTGDHYGLSIMHARAERLQGVFTVESSKGKGTRVTLAWIPWQQEIKLPEIEPSKSLEPA